MQRLVCLLMMGLLLIPAVSHSETWEEFQKTKATGEESGLIPKGAGKLKSKDIIIEGLKKECQVTYQSDELLFHYGLPQLKEESRQNLQNTADALKEAAKNPELSKIQAYYVDGHTCSIGTVENNCRLSWLRAQAVVDELIRLGVPREKLVPRGFGLAYPAHSNDSEATRMLNRRVVLKGDCPDKIARDYSVPCREGAPGDSSGMPGSRATSGSNPSRSATGVDSMLTEDSPLPGLGSSAEPMLIPMGKSAGQTPLPKGFKNTGSQSSGATGQTSPGDRAKTLPRGFKPATE